MVANLGQPNTEPIMAYDNTKYNTSENSDYRSVRIIEYVFARVCTVLPCLPVTVLVKLVL